MSDTSHMLERSQPQIQQSECDSRYQKEEEGKKNKEKKEEKKRYI